MDHFGLTSYFDGLKYVKCKPFTKKLRNHIFEEVKRKSQVAKDLEIAREASAARGGWVLRLKPDCNRLLDYIDDMDYDHSLLSWHISTELCWYHDHDDHSDHREHAKLLSDYMMYLVTMQPAIIYGVTDVGQTRLRDTCAEIKREWSLASHDQKDPSAFKIIKYGIMCLGKGLIFFTIWIFSPAQYIIISLFVVIFGAMIPRDMYKKLKLKLKHSTWCAPLLQVFSGLEQEEEKVRSTREKFCKTILHDI